MRKSKEDKKEKQQGFGEAINQFFNRCMVASASRRPDE